MVAAHQGLRRRVAALLLAALTLASCVATGPRPPRAAMGAAALDQEVFAEAYFWISDVYLRPVDLSRLALDGLGGLRRLDGRIAVFGRDGMVVAMLGGEEIAALPAPDMDDAEGWATTTVRVVAALRGASDSLRAADAETVYETVFEALAADLDAHSRYASAQSAAEERALRDGFGGVGLSIEMVDGRHLVHGVDDDGPAAVAGLRVGDMIVAVDRAPLFGVTAAELRQRLRGPIDSVVQVTTRGEDGAERTVALQRARIVPETVDMTTAGDVAVLRIETFNAATAHHVRDAVAAARARVPGARGFVLDLRGNPGGYLDQAVAVADLFIPDGRIVSTRGRHPGSMQFYEAVEGDVTDGAPLVVLVDGGSASAAEIVATALQDTGRAVLVGATSFGKGSVQVVHRLPNDGELFLTWSRLFAPTGYTIDSVGVMPTICTSFARDADSALAPLREGRLTLKAILAARRANAGDEAKIAARIRPSCPSEAHPGDLDVAVARLLLANPDLYAAALAQSAPDFAARP